MTLYPFINTTKCKGFVRFPLPQLINVPLHFIAFPAPPRHLLITSSWEGGKIVSGVLGPYPEGADLTLACQVSGGMLPIYIYIILYNTI